MVTIYEWSVSLNSYMKVVISFTGWTIVSDYFPLISKPIHNKIQDSRLKIQDSKCFLFD